MGNIIKYDAEHPLIETIGTITYKGDTKLLTESMSTDEPIYVDTLLQMADTENGNGREYPYNILKPSIDRYAARFIPKRSYGELDHPDSAEPPALQRASHRIVKIWWENKIECYGRLKILNTPLGKIVKIILAEGGEVAVSSRGVGSVEELGSGLYRVMDDFEMICWDIVSNPSTKGAWVHVVNENQKINTNINKQNTKIDNIIGDILSSLN
jgi:hypothetical protein